MKQSNYAEGFYALGLESDVYGPALAIRGTQPSELIDWWTDSDPRGVGYSQFEANWDVPGEYDAFDWLSDLANLEQQADIVGHSMGGALAQWIAAAFTSAGEQIDQLVTFNSPGISSSEDVYYSRVPGDLIAYASEFVPSNAPGGVTHYIVNGDVASMAGEAFVDANVKMASFSDLSMWDFDKHVLPLLNSSIGSRNRRADVSWETPDIGYLNDPQFSHDDPDYNLWLLGIQLGHSVASVSNPALPTPLLPVPAMLKHRGTAENARRQVGYEARLIRDALTTAADVVGWTREAVGQVVMTVGERARDVFEHVRVTVQDGFSVAVDAAQTPMLQLDGGVSIDLGDSIDIDLPSWLGGSFTADHLVELVDMDYGGVMDRDHLAVSGQLGLLGDLVTVDGSAELDWARGELTVDGVMDILNGFVTVTHSVQVGARLDLVMRGREAVRIPDGVRLIGGKQIASGDFLLNYVNNLSLSDDFVAGWGSIWTPLGDLKLGLQVWFDGRLPNILGASEIDATAKGKGSDAQSFEVAPGVEWVLLAAQWENASTTAALTMETPSGLVLTEADVLADPSMAIVEDLTGDRRTVVRVDSPEAGTWVVTLTDPADLGVVEITAYRHDSAPAVSVVGMSDGLLREPVQIELEAFDPDSDAKISLFYDRDSMGFDGVMIAQGIAETDGPTQYVWDTTGVAAGDYYVYAMILDGQNPPVMAYSDSTLQITDSAVVLDRHVFYNNSAFDGNDPAANGQDDDAIAPDKEALLPDGTAEFENYTSYSRGINGIMVDVAGLAAVPTVDDFRLKVGNDDDPAGWGDAPVPVSVTVRPGEGVSDSDRVTIIWADNLIQKQWLQVTVLATENTGLAEPDVFYYGNAIGESGDSTTDAKVNATDMLAARNNPHNFFNPAPIDDFVDFDRDQKVNATDMLIARNNTTNFFTALKLISVPGGKSGESRVESLESRAESSELWAGTLAWLYEFESADRQQRSPETSGAAREATDLLLAGE